MSRKILDGTVVISFLTVFTMLFSATSYAQSASEDKSCVQAQETFITAMGLFRTAYFEQEDAIGTAEFVMDNEIEPAVKTMQLVCPENVIAEVNAGLTNTKAALDAPNREQLVECDKAVVSYRKLLSRFDSVNLSSYEAYRALLYGEIRPSAETAVEVCPQNMGLVSQTQADVIERQRRLDKMQEIEEFSRPTVADNIDTDREEYFDSLSDE